jgi:hypothetical protein
VVIGGLVTAAGQTPALLTPELAARLLATLAVPKVDAERVAHYAREIAGGRFKPGGVISVSSITGGLLDGRHRCAAVVQCGVSVPVVLVHVPHPVP